MIPQQQMNVKDESAKPYTMHATCMMRFLMLVTEWKEFRLPSWAVVKKTMSQQVVMDGRNIYDKKEMEEQGFIYHCIGK